MPTRPKVFLALPDACRLRPCNRTHLKNGLVPHSYVGGTYDKYTEVSRRSLEVVYDLSSQVGLHSVGRRTSGLFCRVCFGTGEFLRPRALVGCIINNSGGALSTGCGCVLHGSFGCVPPLDTTLMTSRGRPPGFKPLQRGWVYRPAPEAPQKGECRRGLRHFWNCLTRAGSGPVTGPTSKRPCATFLRWWSVG